MRDMLRLSPRGRGRLAIVLISGLALGSVGCDGDNASTQALRSAEIKLRGMMPAREQVPGAPMAATYTEVISELTPVTQSGSPAQRAAASAIIAQAHAGLAQAPAMEATDIEQETLNAILQLRAAHTRFLTLSAMAQAAAAFDPQPEIADIEKQSVERDRELVALQQRKAEIDGQIQKLRDEAKGLLDRARAKRQEAATLKGRVANETATAGEELMKQAHSLTREADKLEVQAATLEAEAAKIEPDSGQTQLDIDRVNEQKQLLASSREAVLKRAQAARAESAEARQAAQQVADEMRSLVNKIESRRAEDLAKAHQDATRHLETAASAATQSAASGSRSSANMAAGAHHQALGDLAWARAQGYTSWAEALDALANAQPALPNAAEYKSKAEAARASAKEMLEAATQAYKSADQAYQAAGGGNAEVQQQMNRINALLAEAVTITSDGSEDIRVEAAPMDMGGGEATIVEGTQPPAGSTPGDTLAALKSMSESGDFANFADYFVAETPQDQQMVQAFSQLARAGARLQQALKRKFGDEGSDALKMMAQQGGAGPMDFDMDPASIQFQIDGDRATAQGPGGEPIVMRQVDGRWKLELSTAGIPAEARQVMLASAPAMAKAMEDVAGEVQAGKFGSVQEAMAAVMQGIMGAAMQNAPGGGRPGSRPPR